MKYFPNSSRANRSKDEGFFTSSISRLFSFLCPQIYLADLQSSNPARISRQHDFTPAPRRQKLVNRRRLRHRLHHPPSPSQRQQGTMCRSTKLTWVMRMRRMIVIIMEMNRVIEGSTEHGAPSHGSFLLRHTSCGVGCWLIWDYLSNKS